MPLLCVLSASLLWAQIVPAVAAGVSPASGTHSCTRSHPLPPRCPTRCCWAITKPTAGVSASLRGLSKLTQVSRSEPPSKGWPLLPASTSGCLSTAGLSHTQQPHVPCHSTRHRQLHPCGRLVTRCTVQCSVNLTGCLLPRWAPKISCTLMVLGGQPCGVQCLPNSQAVSCRAKPRN